MNELFHHGIKDMRWGVRRYQNQDGTLTEAGRKRYAKDIAKNNQKKRKDRAEESSLKDPERWVKEDLEKNKRFADSINNAVRQAQNIERETREKPVKKRMDLSKMTDQELRQKISREQLERQYNDLFNKAETPKISKGREILKSTLDVAGGVLAIGSSSLGIALAIKELKS